MTTRTALSRAVTLSPQRRQRTSGSFSGTPPSNTLVPLGGAAGGGGGGFFGGGGGGGPALLGPPPPPPVLRAANQVNSSTKSQLYSTLTSTSPKMDMAVLQGEMGRQADYTRLRNRMYNDYGVKMPKSYTKAASNLVKRARSEARAQIRPRRYMEDGTSMIRFEDGSTQPVSDRYPVLSANNLKARHMLGMRRRRRRRYRGRGMYYAGQGQYYAGQGSFWKKARKGAKRVASWARKHQHNLETIGMAVAPAETLMVKEALAGGAGVAAAKMISGRGAYNSLFPMESEGALIEYDSVTSEHGNLVVRGQEKIADIFGNDFQRTETGSKKNFAVSGDTPEYKCIPFTTFTVDCTPGNFQQFPKLAQHAANFKEYEWISLIFTYKSTLPENWQTTDVTTGKVVMATEYNLKKPTWTKHGEITAQEQKVEGAVTGITAAERTHTLGVECDPAKMTTRALKFIRTKGLPVDEDKQDYDLARVSFGLFGTNTALANQMIGELHVTYEVHFKTHRQYTALGYNIPQSVRFNDFGPGNNAVDGLTEPLKNWTTQGSVLNAGTPSGTNTQEIWEGLFNFKRKGISRDLVYNNIDFLLECTKATNLKGDETNQGTTNATSIYDYRADGVDLKFTFPSNLKGNYEIEIELCGANLIQKAPNSFIDPDADGNFQPIMSRILEPDVTGTCIVNEDFPPSYTNNGIDSYGQTGIKFQFTDNKSSIRIHIHLEQATSTEDNTMTVHLPLLIQQYNPNYTVEEPENYHANLDNNSNNKSYYNSTMVSVKQYNSFQVLGTAGLEYKDSVTNCAETC